MTGIEVIRCEIAPKALYFPSKLHKIIISKAHNSAPNLSIFTYDTLLTRISKRQFIQRKILLTIISGSKRLQII